MAKNFITQTHPPTLLTEPALWFIFQNEEILLTNTYIKIPMLATIEALNLDIKQQQYLGLYDNTHCFAAQVEKNSVTAIPSDMSFQPIRESHDLVNDTDLFQIATRAKQILYWDKTSQFCGSCGQKTQRSLTEYAKTCPNCSTLIFPPVFPAMVVLIWRENEILLARSPHFPSEVYSILAGFVEPGETLEQTVRREVREEVGISIKNLTYVASQPWPFVSNLMLGFTAEYDKGDIQVNHAELEDAKWFSLEKLPKLPKPMTLSRQIIDTHIAKKRSALC